MNKLKTLCRMLIAVAIMGAETLLLEATIQVVYPI